LDGSIRVVLGKGTQKLIWYHTSFVHDNPSQLLISNEMDVQVGVIQCLHVLSADRYITTGV
jgi:hypothetical protein